MATRYNNVKFIKNSSPLYANIFEERGVRFINQFATATYTPLTPGELSSLAFEQVYWEYGDRLDKLASKYYKDPTLWWIIARYNSKPTDAHYQPGDLVFIPRPVQLIMKAYITR